MFSCYQNTSNINELIMICYFRCAQRSSTFFSSVRPFISSDCCCLCSWKNILPRISFFFSRKYLKFHILFLDVCLFLISSTDILISVRFAGMSQIHWFFFFFVVEERVNLYSKSSFLQYLYLSSFIGLNSYSLLCN